LIRQLRDLQPDEEECYIFEERLGMMCGPDLPTLEQIECAIKVILDRREEMKQQKDLKL